MRRRCIVAVFFYLIAGISYAQFILGTQVPRDDLQQLLRRNLAPPLAGLRSVDIRDTFNQRRAGGAPHEAADIVAPRGTPILAISDGIVQKLFLSKPGGVTIYEFDNDGTFCYYYAHLERYADGLKEGMRVKRGDVIGYVGTSGNAFGKAPHLHLAIFKLGPQKHWWEGTPINPYPLLIELLRAQSQHSKLLKREPN
jgi:murein DD-endopeptidase MepM/ murein hydrolase activator NlpD